MPFVNVKYGKRRAKAPKVHAKPIARWAAKPNAASACRSREPLSRKNVRLRDSRK
jgi:hypothetical protein